jgi:hypothetical protein
VAPRSALAGVLARWARLVGVVAALVTLTASSSLGALGGVMGQLFGEEHLCKCGMTAGKCGCPECERLEQQRLHEHDSSPVPAVKAHCGQDSPGLAFGSTPPASLPARTAKLPVPLAERLPPGASLGAPDDLPSEPPTPPPRLAAV